MFARTAFLKASRACFAAGEGIPMISRSDGKTFHLLLADFPARYPAEKASGNTEKTSCASGIPTSWTPDPPALQW
jgi:hypothetical protein